MNVGIYQGAAAMQALEQWQATIAQNLAASTVPGYKQVEVDFDAVLSTKPGQGSSGVLAQQSAAMPRAALRRDFTQGELRATGEPENVALQGPGYFQVQAADGKPAYTRDGEFHRSAANTIVTKTGLPVLGQGGEPLQIDPKKGPVVIGEDGRITQGSTEVARIGVFSFDESQASQLAGGLIRPAKGTSPSPVASPSVQSGFLEGSNVSPMRAMVELITVQRAYEANQKAVGAHDQRISQAIQILGNPTA